MKSKVVKSISTLKSRTSAKLYLATSKQKQTFDYDLLGNFLTPDLLSLEIDHYSKAVRRCSSSVYLIIGVLVCYQIKFSIKIRMLLYL
jgi:hypothetical protein